MDKQIGDVIEALKKKGLYDNTIIAIIGDHGSQWNEHDHYYYPGHLYQQAIHIPLIIRVPGMEGGVKIDDPTLQVDLMPTIAEIAGMVNTNPHAEQPFPCRSLLPLMRGDANEEQYRSYRERNMLMTTRYDMLGYTERFKYKIIFDRPNGTYLFFDIEKDPMELNNLVDSEPELFKRIRQNMIDECRRNEVFIAGNLPTHKRLELERQALSANHQPKTLAQAR